MPRPRTPTDTLDAAIEAVRAGEPVREVAGATGLSERTIRRALRGAPGEERGELAGSAGDDDAGESPELAPLAVEIVSAAAALEPARPARSALVRLPQPAAAELRPDAPEGEAAALDVDPGASACTPPTFAFADALDALVVELGGVAPAPDDGAATSEDVGQLTHPDDAPPLLAVGDVVQALPGSGLTGTHAGVITIVEGEGATARAGISWKRVPPGKGSTAPLFIPADGGGLVYVVARAADGGGTARP